METLLWQVRVETAGREKRKVGESKVSRHYAFSNGKGGGLDEGS